MDTVSRARLDRVADGLGRIFGTRLVAVVGYGRYPHPTELSHSLALVSSLTVDDLTALAAVAREWHRVGAATPLVLPEREFARSLDAFPIEWGEIIDTHVTLVGHDPLAGVRIDPLDARRAVEVQAASHLIHLRENFVELGGQPGAVDALVRDSAPMFATLLYRMAALEGARAETAAELSHWATTRAGLDARVVGDVLALAGEPNPAVDPARLFPEYLATVEALVRHIDRWRAAS